ncbi:MAG: VWA domain-containing protein [Thermoanaerobaculia bacterium]
MVTRLAELRRRLPALALGSLLWAQVPFPLLAQEPLDGGFSEDVGVGLVLVPVVVRSNEGYLRGLKAEDFRLFVDDKPVPIESFENRSDAPLSTVFLQDLSGSMGSGGKLEASREAVRFFLDQATDLDEFALAIFADGKTSVDVPFTSDLQALRESVAGWEAYGTTALNDAVAWLPEITAGGSHAKRAALLVTDGVDNASNLSPEEARNLVRSAQIPVYVLGLGSGSPYDLAPNGDKLGRFADVLNLLSLYTGGRYFPVEGPNALKEAVVDIVDDLRHQYVLSFSTSGRGKRTSHRLRVEVPRKNVKVLSRQGYTGNLPVALAGKG